MTPDARICRKIAEEIISADRKSLNRAFNWHGKHPIEHGYLIEDIAKLLQHTAVPKMVELLIKLSGLRQRTMETSKLELLGICTWTSDIAKTILTELQRDTETQNGADSPT